ncbi:oxygen-dependent coproporphyrinogen oxidase [Paenirhodobacter sp. CAU 1674]|uniref:oxygen-dependent coproporphyrinogen oxidase n=1 Tax=Paenirhodobacter sp. CAU 1674 TaxID=3032596 RepID=UPI0023D9D9DA|nr:oxygen-dependent coproporphyrinogen oxidase [Paenirhodobacter sp. CAU 1674]MDF2141355.1 oxygen-dependent coproporphyrinogen oxidase [Paenirhodobacter sp. CAU 1674]
MTETDEFTARKATASAWFSELRDRIVGAFEALEDGFEGPGAPGRFEVTPTTRTGPAGEDQGGGKMSVMRGGRVFEKVGVNISTVWGTLAPRAQAAMAARGVPGMAEDPRFWASGISLVAHMQNPHTPAVHMNTRMFWTPGAWWFGGGADLNPCIEYSEDTAHFHVTLKQACDAHDPDYYPRFKAWADEYFFVPHRGRARGVGGIFYDDLNTGGALSDSWDKDFAFTRDVGAAFLPAFVPVTERRLGTPATTDDRETQLIHRGLYAEYNLVYDRGTKFGLETGHNADAVLMSLPPVAKWP